VAKADVELTATRSPDDGASDDRDRRGGGRNPFGRQRSHRTQTD
jgi:hypothetical protein